MARPRKPYEFTQTLADEICEQTENCALGLRALCKLHKHWPPAREIRKWTEEIPSFKEQYARAKNAQVENLADEIIEISDDDSRDTVQTVDHDGNPILLTNHAALHRDKMRTDNRKWIASKLLPKKYGDKKEEKESDTNYFVSMNRDKIVE